MAWGEGLKAGRKAICQGGNWAIGREGKRDRARGQEGNWERGQLGKVQMGPEVKLVKGREEGMNG